MKKIFYFKLSTFLILLVFSLKANCQKDLTFKITDGAKYTTGRVSGFWGKANDEIQIGEASLMAYKYYGWCIVESKNIPFQGDIEIFNMALGFGISDFTGTDIEIEMGLFFKDEINPYTDSGSDIQSFIENESSGKTCSIVINSTQNTAIFELTSEMKKIVARALSSNDDWVGFYFRQKKRNSNDYASCEFYGYTSSIITSRIIYSYSFEDELEFNDTYASAFNLGNFNYNTNTALMTNVLCIENPEVRGYTDVDYFKFSFNNKYYLIIVKATDYGPYVLSFSISNGTLTVETKQADYQINTILELKDSQGNLYATDDNGGWADFSKIIYTFPPPTGSLKVNIYPSDAVDAYAKWNVDGGSWKDSGTTVSGLSTGNHTVSFRSISGWNTPSNKTVSIEDSQTTAVSGTYTQQTGSLSVTISPNDAVNAGAQWNVDGGAWKNNGATVSALSVGNHTVSFKDISGWSTPSNKTVSISADQTTSTTGTYTQQTGSLSVSLAPSDAINAGAQWNVDGGAWKNSGTTVSGLSVGNHTVSYKSISGWNAPSNKTVTINSNQTTSTTGTYTQQTQQTGSLKVTLSPSDAVNAGAQWNVDGGAWKNSGVTVSGLSIGNHTVSYKSISGWNAPSNKTVTINSNQTISTTGTYTQQTQQTGSLKVTLSPSDAVNRGAQWNVDGGAWKNSGVTVSGLSIGNHTVSFKSISGWNAPSNKTVTINSNQTTSTTGTYTKNNSENELIWEDGFENYTSGTFPSNWVADANATNSSKNYTDNSTQKDGTNSLKLFGTLGGCWGALAYRSISVSPPYYISIDVKNGTEQLSGCHPDRTSIALRKGTSWSNPARSLVDFKNDGKIYANGGDLLTSYSTNTWINVIIKYELPSSNQVKTTFWINNNLIGEYYSSTIAEENGLDNLQLAVQEGTAWFDNIKIYKSLSIPTDLNNYAYENKIKIYPNPVKEQVTISVDDPDLINSDVKIINSLGSVVNVYRLDSYETKINTSSLLSGFYIIQIQNGNFIYNEKITK
jgi:hypothetical protein